ncbi:hypothetical protein BIFDEN_00431 [Bifidobacterium dentium ATCC 27678]|nr:hypothetical protein BIFDEN_00431 [Bifidobacterium dentium ATCC 27678]
MSTEPHSIAAVRNPSLLIPHGSAYDKTRIRQSTGAGLVRR